MASRIIIANMSVSYRTDWGRLAEIIVLHNQTVISSRLSWLVTLIDWGRLAEISVLHTVKSRAVDCLG